MGFQEHNIALLLNQYDKQEAIVRTESGDTASFGIRKGVHQGCVLSPTLLNWYAEIVGSKASLEEMEEGVRIGGRVISNLRYTDGHHTGGRDI